MWEPSPFLWQQEEGRMLTEWVHYVRYVLDGSEFHRCLTKLVKMLFENIDVEDRKGYSLLAITSSWNMKE